MLHVLVEFLDIVRAAFQKHFIEACFGVLAQGVEVQSMDQSGIVLPKVLGREIPPALESSFYLLIVVVEVHLLRKDLHELFQVSVIEVAEKGKDILKKVLIEICLFFYESLVNVGDHFEGEHSVKVKEVCQVKLPELDVEKVTVWVKKVEHERVQHFQDPLLFLLLAFVLEEIIA